LRKFFFLFVIVIVVSGFSSCGGGGLNGRYVDVWDFYEEGDAVSVYEFTRKGDLIQSLDINPNKALNFKGVENTVSGKYELEDNNIIIILDEGSYEMQVLENTKEYMVFGIPQSDGSVWERKFAKKF
jgi:hypothetical protein